MSSFIITGYSNVNRSLVGLEHGIVTANGALYSTAADAISGAGANTLQVDGGVYAGDQDAYDHDGTSAEIRVGSTGVISALDDTAIELTVANDSMVHNAGTIYGGFRAIDFASSDASTAFALTNSGEIQANGYTLNFSSGIGFIDILNSGLIASTAASAISMSDTGNTQLVNSGEIRGAGNSLTYSGGDKDAYFDLVTNYGLITGSVLLNRGDDIISNFGTLSRGQITTYVLYAGRGNDIVYNGPEGTIAGRIALDYGDDTLTNDGVIQGNILLGPSVDVAARNIVLNTGRIVGDVLGSGGSDEVTNAGQIVGTVQLGDGDDQFYSHAGQISSYVTGGAGRDVMRGGAGQDEFYGDTEADALFGGANDDVLYSGTGDDFVFGGAGDDTINGGAGSDSIGGGTGHDQIVGDGGNDTIIAFDGHDTVTGNAGSDEISGGAGDDDLNGGNGLDLIYGGAGNDTIGGGTDADTLNGGDGEDLILGWLGDDLIFGNAGHDMLDGQGGNDTLAGGWGNDTLSGGADADVFRMIRANGDDVITDFENNTDLIDVSALQTTYGALATGLSDYNGGALIDLTAVGGTGSIWVQGVPSSFLNANDFIF